MISLIAAVVLSVQSAPPVIAPGAPGAVPRQITAAESLEMTRSRHTQADVRFMQHMIVHHQQAVDMVALIEGRSTDAGVAAIGARIARSQDDEMALMRTWLEQRGEPVEADDLHHHHHHGDHSGHAQHSADPGDIAVMPGMLSPNQMATLEAASGPEFDWLFLEGMIYHHQGAIDMVNELMAFPDSAEDVVMSEFVGHVVADQRAEILRMQSMLSEMEPPASRARRDHDHSDHHAPSDSDDHSQHRQHGGHGHHHHR